MEMRKKLNAFLCETRDRHQVVESKRSMPFK